MQATAYTDPTIEALLSELDKHPGIRWSEQRVAQLGYDPSTVRRTFKRQFAMTFLEMARQRRLREGFDALSNGSNVITAQHEANFSSGSAFRAAFASLLGCSPSSLKSRGQGFLQASWIATPLGDMVVLSSTTHLYLLEFVDRKALPMELKKLQDSTRQGIGIGRPEPTEQAEQELRAFFAGDSAVFSTPLAYQGSAFSRSVWEELRQIPVGQTRSYSQIAQRIGRASATRAVARANGANQIALMVPCHRVIGADGSLTGYGGGLWRKQRLIEIERRFTEVLPFDDQCRETDRQSPVGHHE